VGQRVYLTLFKAPATLRFTLLTFHLTLFQAPLLQSFPISRKLKITMSNSTTYDIKVDNVGPLTTTFTGPSTCLQTTTLIGSAAYYVAAFWDDVTACYPPGTATPFNFHTLPQYYSPGICPSGWAPVTSAGADFPGTASNYNQYLIPSPTQVWLCCPSYVHFRLLRKNTSLNLWNNWMRSEESIWN